MLNLNKTQHLPQISSFISVLEFQYKEVMPIGKGFQSARGRG